MEEITMQDDPEVDGQTARGYRMLFSPSLRE